VSRNLKPSKNDGGESYISQEEICWVTIDCCVLSQRSAQVPSYVVWEIKMVIPGWIFPT